MNFFKSILLDEADPPKAENPHESAADSKLKSPEGDGNNAHEVAPRDGNAEAWSFGGLIKTLATRSESVIETYRKDLQEFGSGLRKETETIREVASRAVKDLPASLEAGTSAAHGVLDGMLKSTADIMSKEAFASDAEKEVLESNRSLNSGRYSWFDVQLNAIQSDLNTFCEEPEDAEDYKRWKLGFQLEDKRNEIRDLAGEYGILEGAYKKVVPSVVDHESFWCRYFYRVDKLKQQEKVRANLVKRAITADDDDDDFSWDVDEDEKDGNGDEVTTVMKGNVVDDGDKKNAIDTGKEGVSSSEKEVKGNEIGVEKIEENVKCEESVKSDENVVVEKAESSEKSSDDTVASMPKAETRAEEDLGWDEIEDIGSGDENRISTGARSERANRADLRKQINDDDDEDLSWDIEDDDEPVKS